MPLFHELVRDQGARRNPVLCLSFLMEIGVTTTVLGSPQGAAVVRSSVGVYLGCVHLAETGDEQRSSLTLQYRRECCTQQPARKGPDRCRRRRGALARACLSAEAAVPAIYSFCLLNKY